MGLMKSRSLVNKYESTSGSGHENDGHSYGDECSICLETTSNINNDRSPVKLRCGHEFHLDCIGSAFNAKRRMQCPNCRRVEKGEWRCEAVSSSLDEDMLEEIYMDDNLYNQDNYLEDNYVEETLITEIVSSFETRQELVFEAQPLVSDHPGMYDMSMTARTSSAIIESSARNSSLLPAAPRDRSHGWIQNHENYYPPTSYDINGVLNNFWGSETTFLLQPELMLIDQFATELYYMTSSSSYGSFYDLGGGN